MSDPRVLIRLPTWLGDSVMCTPALDNMRRQLPTAKFVVVGSPPVLQLFLHDPRCDVLVPETTKSHRLRYLRLTRLGRRMSREHGPFDLAFTFKNSLSARWLLLSARASRRIGAAVGWTDVLLTDAILCGRGDHCVERYNQIINGYFGACDHAGPLTLHVGERRRFQRPTVGIAPGAAFGSARRWDAARFAEAAVALGRRFDIVILGSAKERELSDTIEAALRGARVANYRNLIGQTVSEMVSTMAGLALYIGNDSGTTHIASALAVPTVAIFGSTSPSYTYPWRHPASCVVCRSVPCAPCNRHVCPLEHHACMTEISVRDVLDAALSLVQSTEMAEGRPCSCNLGGHDSCDGVRRSTVC